MRNGSGWKGPKAWPSETHDLGLNMEGVLLPALSDEDREKLLSMSRPKSYPKGHDDLCCR
jgi:hypothetical protein